MENLIIFNDPLSITRLFVPLTIRTTYYS